MVYRNTSSLKDISQEMEESKVKSSYDNKVVSYTLEELIIYSEPDLKSEPVGIMYSGSEADGLARGEEWSKIQSGEVTGYIRNVDVLFDSEAEVIASVIGNKQAKVNADVINVYAEADDSAAVISTLEKGAEIDAYEENGNYTLISCDNGFGYISNDSFDVSYNLSKAVSMAEIEAIKEEERAEAARKAAEEAAAQAAAAQAAQDAPQTLLKTGIALPQRGLAKADAERLTRSLKHTMSTYCMINRTEKGLSAAQQELEGLKSESAALSMADAQDGEIAALARLQSQLLLAKEMVKAMRKRTESLGSHYRAD